ncbi:MAG: hypothetical protein IT304_08435 [Dehalococcoidia bacterium]|nr:hypothetical protein [Dehalococcoidia bacterium]
MELSLEPAEVTLLRQLLERSLGDLRMEIGKTENYELRQDLKQREGMLRTLIERLGTEPAVR